jgi:gamma-glutamylcyclotransferase (GGCT)/AIG2-like uncharacterized protein YtfP
MNRELIFVYGKLRKGGEMPMDENFPGSAFVAEATVSGMLYDLGRYPGLVIEPSGSRVIGAVYEVDDETLKRLDEIEASAKYYRRQYHVDLGERTETCWIYLPEPESCAGGQLIASGDWIEHSRSRAAI